MKDKEFYKYAAEHGLVVVSRGVYDELIKDHLKVQKLKEMTAKYEPVEDKE